MERPLQRISRILFSLSAFWHNNKNTNTVGFRSTSLIEITRYTVHVYEIFHKSVYVCMGTFLVQNYSRTRALKCKPSA